MSKRFWQVEEHLFAEWAEAQEFAKALRKTCQLPMFTVRVQTRWVNPGAISRGRECVVRLYRDLLHDENY